LEPMTLNSLSHGLIPKSRGMDNIPGGNIISG
jgi:hypothetical protein